MLPELRDTSVIIFVVVGIQMIKDRHLGVSRDAIRSVWKSHLPGCSDREKYVMWRHAFNVKVTFACLLGQRCHAFSVKVTFACLFGQREVCHVMPCVQCKGHIYLFAWTERNTSPDVMRSMWRSHLPAFLGREKYVTWCHAINVKVTFTCLFGQREMSCDVMRSMWIERNLSCDVMRPMWRSHLPVCLDRQIFEWQDMLSFNMIIVDILFQLFPAAKKLQ